MRERIRRVAVIGTGPAGAIATDALVKEQAFDEVCVFERHAITGGTWVYDPNLASGIPCLGDLIENRADLPITLPDKFPCETSRVEKNSPQNRFSDTGVHETLHSNLPPSTMCFTQEPLPEKLSEQTLKLYGPDAPFRHREIIRDWVEGIFRRGGYEKLITFNTTVENIHKRSSSWVLTLRQEVIGGDKDRWWQQEFDAVVVASGHYNIPYIPNIPGLVEYEKRYPGSIMHSKHYRGTDAFREKKVIVVGGSVSAFEAIHEIRAVAKHPIISSLHKPLYAFGWTPFVHPHIQVRSGITAVDADAKCVEFADGSVVKDVDLIFFATGYDFSFPFLPQVKIDNRRIHGLYQHIFSRHDPTLAFIGMVTGGLTFRVFEWQAVAAARVLAGRATLPSAEDMEKWERNTSETNGNGLSFFNIGIDYEGYFEALRSLAGDPAPGTTGRVLPKYEKWWEEEFLQVIEARKRWWEQERRIAEGADGSDYVVSPELNISC